MKMKKIITRLLRLDYKTRNDGGGFTLLELLVVIGIIGILVALGTVAYSSAQSSGRDARRKQDLVAMQNALEEYYSANSFVYPTTCNTAATYLKSNWPEDPMSPTKTYVQNCTSTTTYCICAIMEKTTAGNSNATTCATGTWIVNGPNYCVGNLQ
ncbi:hypothetical protein COT86_00030 [Candidatus Collierbacteria bacterium CG10_big_fil_rev_8_21_14_0_10_43_36]|uniref:Type II secretion system protein GspG C-terminal domain-containing protein n=3 Tax=Candidatus Collieribacteriota TaxID=1752725 RepID=A0A2H0DUQ2_9BACT|nr:MAG: hypothetical protein COW83_04995 [Candidatus Collierbacteria bacterium CG22_combo_CG10-13_8_21_14_all_43_12]PIS00145.1 MAG: hypothetical protein COT86_00030 [Candidatus Collierbacteria bacterium CG10_big_fil_rev_8_21_14_0_10_43_36]PIZ24087.1 MAG: hypothetical protein COY48_04765 [Candidatus Collierbacteria bacterium CG_4_10_14_0_8_um_filter_43_86]PJB47800.1 MAG: hypothetical protein CO104_02825 [Candidatus Collierbacteria bacterium CG_4_9_14_3_um_filter_43_16]